MVVKYFYLFRIIFSNEQKQKMRKINLQDQIGSFHNKDQKGLFTFYREFSDLKSETFQIKADEDIRKSPPKVQKQLMDGKKLQIENKRLYYKQTRIKCMKSSTPMASPPNLVFHQIQNDHQIKKSHPMKLSTQPAQPYVQSREMFNFNREKHKNPVEMSLLDKQISNLRYNQHSNKRSVNSQIAGIPRKYYLRDYALHRENLRSALKSSAKTNQLVSCKSEKSVFKDESIQTLKCQQSQLNQIIILNELASSEQNKSKKLNSVFFPLAIKLKNSRANQKDNCNYHNESLDFKLKNHSFEIQSFKNKIQGKSTNKNKKKYSLADSRPQRKSKKKFLTVIQTSKHQEQMVDFFKQKASNLLQKNSHSSQQRKNNFSQLRGRKPESTVGRMSQLEKNSSNRKLIQHKIDNLRNQERHKALNAVKRNQAIVQQYKAQKVMLKIIKSIKNRYQTI